MYAIIKTGGKQYRVSEGVTVEVERLEGEVGQTVEFADVLLVSADDGVQIGNPAIPDVRVVGTIVEHKRDRKVLVFKFKKTKMYRKLKGHRQAKTGVRIDRVEGLDKKPE